MGADAADGAPEPDASPPDKRPDGQPPPALTIACVLIGLECLALLGATVLLVVKTITGTPGNIGRALFGAVLAVVAAIMLGVGARALLRLQPAARTPVVVLQLLALPVAYTLAFEADRPGYGGPILLAALAVLYLLFTPPVRAVLDREPPR